MRLSRWLPPLLLLGLAVYVVTQRAALGAWAFSVTGEEEPLSQARALWHIALGYLRPPLDLQAEVPIQHNGVNPFGINTFLQQEVELSKREEQVRLIAEAGFQWIRQEFPWQDIEISAKGNFDDCRNGPCISAWLKYDHIVELAEKHGLTIIARLSSPPAWSRADGEARGGFAPPDNMSDFADYAEAVATRYRGRLRYYQIWNEPNIYPEWGDQPADPEAYTRLLCETYARLKRVDPGMVVLAAPLAPTNPLGLVNGASNHAAELNDFVYLQRMYNAGAGRCFDVMSVQGYGLGSGPGDRRLRPLQFNYARNLFIRDLMVKNGDAHKAIWIAEVNWNAAPPEVPTIFGRVTEAQQARYAPLAYQRAQQEWPWVGVTMFWFFKRATDAEKGEAWYYFRMADPDFTLRPVYVSMKDYIAQARVMYAGWYQEDHWAVDWSDGWRTVTDARFTLGAARAADGRPGAALRFVFEGSDLWLEATRGPQGGPLTVRVDDGPAASFDLRAPAPTQTKLPLARNLPIGRHRVEIVSQNGADIVDGFIVRRSRTPDHALILAGLVGAVLAAAWWVARRR